MAQPIGEPRVVRRCRQRSLRELRVKRTGRDDHRAALHQELVDGEYLYLCQVFRIDDHQQICVVRHGTVCEVGGFDIEFIGKRTLQLRELIAGHPLLRHVRRRSRRRYQRDRTQQSARETLQSLLDAAFRGFRRQRIRQRYLYHRGVVCQRQVKIESIGVEEARHHRLKPVVDRNVLCNAAVSRLRVQQLYRQLASAFFGEFRQYLFEHDTILRQIFRQSIVAREIPREAHGVLNVGEDAAASLKTVQNLLDRASQIVFRVSQLNVQFRFANHLDLDQIAETQDLVLVAVTQQHVEVGVDQAGLVAIRHLKRHRPNTIFGIGFVFELRIFRRIYYLHSDLVAPGHAKLCQQVTHARHQRCEQRMGLAAEIAANQQRFFELSQVTSRRVRDRVNATLGYVHAQCAEGVEPHISQQQVAHQ